MDLFTVLIFQPVYNLLIIFYRLFGGDLGLAIIAIAFLSRVITFPITMRQVKMAEQGQEFNAKVKEIKKKYKNDKEKQAQEMMKVQSQYLPAQLGGCFSTILQLILLVNIFNVIQDLFAKGVAGFNSVAYSFVPQFATTDRINPSFFGVIDLGLSPEQVGYGNAAAILPYLMLVVLVGITQWGSGRILGGLRKKKQLEAEKGGKGKKSSKSKKAKDVPADFGEIMQRSTQQTMLIFPIFIVLLALRFPAGLSLYWTVQSGFVIIQQLLVDKFSKRA